MKRIYKETQQDYEKPRHGLNVFKSQAEEADERAVHQPQQAIAEANRTIAKAKDSFGKAISEGLLSLKRVKKERGSAWEALVDKKYQLRRQDDGKFYYFDFIPQGVAGNILKVQSSQHESDSWMSYVPLNEVITLMGTGADWAKGLKYRVDTLHIYPINSAVESAPKSKGVACAFGMRNAYDFILVGGGNTIGELVVHKVCFHDEISETKAVLDFEKSLPNLSLLT